MIFALGKITGSSEDGLFDILFVCPINRQYVQGISSTSNFRNTTLTVINIRDDLRFFFLKSSAQFDLLNLLHFKHKSFDIMEYAEKVPISNEDALQLCGQTPDGTKEFIMQQTMYRIKDPRVSLPFYARVLGMKLLTKLDFPSMKFSLYFMGYEYDTPGDLSSNSRIEWALSRKATIELTHNWGTENDPNFSYHNGNQEPKGFGHIGIMVPDVYKACEHFEKHGVNFIKKCEDGKMKGIAFITDPDGYWIEIFNNKMTAEIAQQF